MTAYLNVAVIAVMIAAVISTCYFAMATFRLKSKLEERKEYIADIDSCLDRCHAPATNDLGHTVAAWRRIELWGKQFQCLRLSLDQSNRTAANALAQLATTEQDLESTTANLQTWIDNAETRAAGEGKGETA